MILLSGHSLTQARRVPVEALSLNLKERESTAAMTPADMTGIGTESWFLDDVNPGGGIVWRVKSIEQAFATDTPTVHLEHVINTLRDRILFGEITPADISGNPSAEKCSAEQTVRYILSRQSDWRLGNFGYNVSNPYKFDGDTLYDALVKVSNSLDECWWSFDMSQYPFVLNIIQKPAGVTCEMRAGRNLTAITKIVDKSGMYTRFYPIGKDDLHISTEYVSRNENIYGIISKVEVDPSKETEEELRRWADERLKKHAEPTVTVTAEGFELADATGESLDRLTLGRLCRIPLTEFNTTIEERIVELNYPDKAHNPENVQITLANNQDDLAAIIADTINNGGGSSGSFGRAGARQQKEDHAWIEDTEDHVALCAEGIVGYDANGKPNWKILSQIVVDGKGIHQSVEEIQRGNVIRDTKIEQNERAITLEANNRVNADNELQGKITVEADRITQEVTQRKNGDEALSGRITVEANRITQEVTDRTNADSTLSGRITTEAGRITAEVTRAKGAEDVLSGRLTITENAITQEVTDRTNADSTLSGRITTEAGRITAEVTRATGAEETLAGRLTITESAITQEVTDRTNADNTLDGKITVEAGKITQIVSAVGSNGEVTAASIVLAINGAGESEAHIDANKVYIGNTKSTTVIDGKLTTTNLSSAISSLDYVTTQSLSARRFSLYDNPAESSTSVNVASTALRTASLVLSGNTYYLHLYAIDGTECVSTQNNAMSFSRATTLGGTWSGGTLTVNATPQGNRMTFALYDATGQDVTWTGRTGEITVYSNVDGGETKIDTGKKLTVTAPIQSQTYNHSWSGGTLTVTGAPSGSTTTAALYDLTSADVTWSGRTGTIAVYANKNGDETKTDTGKRLTVTAPIQSQSFNHSWSGGTLTVSASPSGNETYVGIFDLRSQDISWSGRNATITVYANKDNGETRYDTGKRLYLTAPIQHNMIWQSWSNGILTMTTDPGGDVYTAGIFDLRGQDVSWDGYTATISLYANADGGETRYDTGKRLTLEATSAYYNGVDAGHADFNSHTFYKAFVYDSENVYYGKIYDSNGRALVANNYYWFGATTNYGGSNWSVNLYTYNPS